MRKLYWKNVNRLGKYNPHKTQKSSSNNSCQVDFELVLNWLRQRGIGKGDILIVHSGYAELEKTGLSPDEVIDRLLELIGPEGTLVMPVIRRYKDLEKAQMEGKDLTSMSFKYKVKKSLVISGMLPFTLMQREGAVISHHPFNPMCAWGPHASDMMKNNLVGEFPSPHGPNSCWKYCYDHGAKVCSIGIDIEHHNTMLHIAEEAFGDWRWSDEDWYEHIKFEIIDENNECKEVIVSNRKDDWGKGYTVEGMKALMNHAADVYEARTFEGECAKENVGSRKVMEKLGMTYDHSSSYTKSDGSATFESDIFCMTIG